MYNRVPAVGQIDFLRVLGLVIIQNSAWERLEPRIIVPESSSYTVITGMIWAGIQLFSLDPRQNHSGMTTYRLYAELLQMLLKTAANPAHAPV